MTATEKRVLREMQLRGGGTLGQIVPRVGLSRSCTYQTLLGLQERGIAGSRPADKGHAHIWTLK